VAEEGSVLVFIFSTTFKATKQNDMPSANAAPPCHIDNPQVPCLNIWSIIGMLFDHA
jgi:hypothetical protein